MTRDEEARREAADWFCEELWSLTDPAESDQRIARMEVDFAVDGYLSVLMSGAPLDEAVEAIGAHIWPGGWTRNPYARRDYRKRLAEALEAAFPHLLAWALMHAEEQTGRAYTIDRETARPILARTLPEFPKGRPAPEPQLEGDGGQP